MGCVIFIFTEYVLKLHVPRRGAFRKHLLERKGAHYNFFFNCP